MADGPVVASQRVALWPLACLAIGAAPAFVLIGLPLLFGASLNEDEVRSVAALYGEPAFFPFTAMFPVALLGWGMDVRERRRAARPAGPVRFPDRGPAPPPPRSQPPAP